MRRAGIHLPRGYRLAAYETVDSTNAEGLRLAAMGEESGLWIWAAEQRTGRGRAGRAWTSHQGNLYASLLLRPHVPLITAMQLSLVAAVAAHDAILSLASGSDARPLVRLKWPNDVLTGGAKLGGILLESASNGSTSPAAVVIGTGINLTLAPQDLGRQAISLRDIGVSASPAEALAALAWTTAEWLARWNEGVGFELIRMAWLERAQTVGEPISVRIGDEILTGTFLGIDEAGALRLKTTDGGEHRITAGDVSLMRSET